MSPEGIKLEHSLRLGFWASNNEAEYEALIVGLRASHKLEATEVEVYSEEGSFEAKDHRMVEYLSLVG